MEHVGTELIILILRPYSRFFENIIILIALNVKL
jgi:hypothetical protein